MLTLQLLPQDEYRWLGENPSPATFPREDKIFPLYHQWRTYKSEATIIVNTHNTGTGKTKAALLRLLKRARDKKVLSPVNDDVLLIAPTNELLLQHAKDAQDFCEENHLPYRVVTVTRDDLEKYKNQEHFSEEYLRRGAALHAILNDASKVDHDTAKRATIFVVNPDIFYYVIYYCYNPFDRDALSSDFIRRFNYVIIDEFHYYDAKQLAAFLFYIRLSYYYHYTESARKRRLFCILTATPQSQVEHYLNSLGVSIEWIRPGEIAPEDQALVEPQRALAPVQLDVYSEEELKDKQRLGGLSTVVRPRLSLIQRWVTQEPPLDGAIISNSLGMISTLHDLLRAAIPADLSGRITGAQIKEDRALARFKHLILATPTVDIGYNFERLEKKGRQNLDFLFFDATSGDEFIQRLGRAGRVLAAEQKNVPSTVWAVVNGACYSCLQIQLADEIAAGMAVSRERLSAVAQTMPSKHDLYAYLRSGAIFELFRPLFGLKRGMSQEQRVAIDGFFADMQRFFANQTEAGITPKYYGLMKGAITCIDEGQKLYGQQRIFPPEVFEALPLLMTERCSPADLKWQHPASAHCLDVLYQALRKLQPKMAPDVQRDVKKVCRSLQDNLRTYFKEQARFSFRDSFQPPLALIADPRCFHSDQLVNIYNALHIVKYYHARYYPALHDWQQAATESGLDRASAFAPYQAAVENGTIQVYCRLLKLRDLPLQIRLCLNARDYSQDAWEERFAYCVTALYGLTVSSDDDRGLDESVRTLLQAQFVPAFVVLDSAKSYTQGVLNSLRDKARIFKLPLSVTFCDGRVVDYSVVVGSMAFHVCAEIPYWAICKDRRVTQKNDDELFIC